MRILSLDLGMSSVGFAYVDLKQQKIESIGVHIFESAEHPKDGSSLALPRRQNRSLRRLVHRRSKRKKDVLKLLQQAGFENLDQVSQPYSLSPWQLRSDALSRRLTDLEFARCLLHITKRRGFKSNRKNTKKANDDEKKKMLQGVNLLKKALEDSGLPTIGAYLNTLDKKRNKPESYQLTVSRDLLEEEVKILFEKQRAFGNKKVSDSLCQDVSHTIFFQKPLREVEKFIGHCTFFPTERRAAKHCFSSELFVFYSKLNNLKIDGIDGHHYLISPEMREELLTKCLTMEKVTFSSIRKLWKIPEEYMFNLVRYGRKEDQESYIDFLEKAEKKTDFFSFKGYRTLQKVITSLDPALWEKWRNDRALLDQIMTVLSFDHDELRVQEKLKALSLPDNVAQEISGIDSFSETLRLSLKAIEKLLPFFQEGIRYDEACHKAGFHHSQKERGHKTFLPPLEKTNNPVVDRASSQARKIINALIKKFGIPDHIHIELARDLGKSWEERKKIEREQKENQERRESLLRNATEFFGTEPSATEYIKYRLWLEQGGFCFYSGEYIDPDVLKDPNGTQIDHIIPFSRSYDDSWNNKILVTTDENQRKGNRTPYEYFGDDPIRWVALEEISKRVSEKKRRNLLLKNFENVENDWKARHLNDTRYASHYLKEQIEKHLSVQRVFCINGAITHYLRNAWELGLKDRQANDLHHAADAAVIACADPSIVQKVTSWNKYEEKLKNPDQKPKPPKPWPSFREDLLVAVDAIFVSRMPVRKITGPAHEETIKSLRKNGDGEKVIVKRLNLSSVKLETLNNMVDLHRNQGLYTVLSERLKQFNNDPKKAFAEPVHMPTKTGKAGPVIRGIRVYDKDKSGLPVRKGIASNGDMIRVDVFVKPHPKTGKDEYYLCPIYVADRAKPRLPNRLCVAAKPEEAWPLIDDTYRFCFSLFKNDLVYFKSSSTEIMGYFSGMDRASATIELKMHDDSRRFRGIGVKHGQAFEKYMVNYFGQKFKVKGEKRLELAHHCYSKPSPIKAEE